MNYKSRLSFLCMSILGLFVKNGLWITVAALILFFIIFPLLFRNFHFIQRHFIFQNNGIRNRFYNFSSPEKFDLIGAVSRFVPSTESGILLGVWQILPFSLIPLMPSIKDDNLKEKWFLKQLELNSRPVVLYCHGKKPSRATSHRILLYQVLQNMDFHVIAFDYRGYADSTAISPTENGVVQDTVAVVNWIRSHCKASIYIWGHSLGTGIATKASRVLCETGKCPDALILQSPFTSLEDELRIARATLPFHFLPWFDYMFIQPLVSQGLEFNNKENILSVGCPLLILHAEDDSVIPYELGRQLFAIANRRQKTSRNSIVRFASFDKKFGYGHNYICKAPELPAIIREFVKEITSKHL